MKKCIAVLLCVCSLCALSVTAFAEATQEDWDRYKNEYSIPEPLRSDYEDEAVYLAAFNAWFSGFNDFVNQKRREEAARIAQEEIDRLAAEKAAEQASQPPDESTPTNSVESAGATNENRYQPVEDGDSSKYPVGSYVDSAGVVWSPDGTRLSQASAPDHAPASYPAEEDALLSDVLDSPDTASAQLVEEEVVEITLEILYELLADVASDTDELASDESIAYVTDLRPTDTPVVVLDGLKALVNSVFGEYTPVTTNTVVTQTVGNDTYEYIIETVAPGAAGVDYEWLAGVFLFGIMLFCLMKLFGGVLK